MNLRADLPAEGSGLDYSSHQGDRTAGLWETYQTQQKAERVLGGAVLLGAVLAAWFVIRAWKSRSRIAEGTAYTVTRSLDGAAAKGRKIGAWWRTQAEKARADRK